MIKQVEWTDDLSVGVELIDDQHKMLIQHLAKVTESVAQHEGPARIGTTLEFLIDYTDFHFSAEERHMAANDYPGLDAQRVQHDEFKTTLSNLEADFGEEGATHALANAIDTLLANWLLKHISSADVEFGAFLTSKGITLPKEG